MLEFLFGWRKASRCKDLLKRVRCRLKLLRNKRGAIAKQERDVIAQLLKNGQHPATTLSRAEQLIKDQRLLTAYDLLDHFCEFIIMNLSYIRKNKDCPNDISEAVSTLIFAAARCANLPELQRLRKLFGQRYGSNFEVAAVEAFPGTHVNQQMREKLSATLVTEDAKFNLIQEIEEEYNLKPQASVSTLRYSDHGCEKVYERDIPVVYSELGVDHTEESYANGLSQIREQEQSSQIKAPIWDDVSYDISNHKRPTKGPSSSQGSSDITSDSANDSRMRKCSLDHNTSKARAGNISKDVTGMPVDFSNLDGERGVSQELKPRSSSSCSSKRRKPSRQRPRRRWHPRGSAHETGRRGLPRNIYYSISHSSTSVLLCTKDVEFLRYYDGISDQSDRDSTAFRVKQQCYTKRKTSRPRTENSFTAANGRSRSFHRSGKTSSKISSEGSRIFSFRYDHEKPNQRCKYVNRRSSYTDENLNPECSLDHPCYFLASDCDEVNERLTNSGFKEKNMVMAYETDSDRVSLTELGRQGDPASGGCNAGQNVGGNKEEEGGADPGSLHPKLLPPYLRTMSVPVERSNTTKLNQGARCWSFRHVHPKLPDYDNLAAKFTAMKEELVKNSSA